ncbi:MAG: alpha/beta hydrolase fold domain-containing protein [Bacteroidota bacterium]
MSNLGWFSDIPSPLNPQSTMEEIHDYVAMTEAGSDMIFNLPNVMEYADKLLEEVTEEEVTIKGVDGNDIPIIINSPKNSQPKQAILFIHGGGMCVLSAKGGTYRTWTRLLAKDGLLVASVDFRNSSGNARAPFPAGLNDCVSGLAWLSKKEEIEEITVHGESGGANLTIATCLRAAKQGIAQDKVTGAAPWAPYIAGPAIWGRWEEAEYESLRENNGAGIPVDQLIYYARTYTPEERDWKNGEAWPVWMTDEEIDLLPPMSMHTNDLETLRDEGIALYRRLAQAGKLVTLENHLDTTHALHVYAPIFNAFDITEQAAKSITAFALRNT